MSAPMSSDRSFLSCRLSGTSLSTMRCARPSTMAVLPTPGSPISTGLFLVRRDSTWMVRRISSSRPITGSILPSRAACVRSRAYFLSASYAFSAEAESAVRPLRNASMAALRFCGVTPARARIFAGVALLVERDCEQQPLDGDEAVAGLLGDLLRLVENRAPAPGPDRPARRRRPTPSAAWRARPRPPAAPRGNCRRRGRSTRRQALPDRRAAP